MFLKHDGFQSPWQPRRWSEARSLEGFSPLSIQLITVLHRIMFPTPRGDFGAVLEVCGRMGVQQHAWLGQAIGWHFWCVRRWGFTSQSRSFLWFSWETSESQYGFKLFEDHQPSCFFFVFWRSCFQTFSDQSQLMADLGPGSTGRMARSIRATITKT